MLCYTIPYYATLHYTILDYTTIQHYANTILHYTNTIIY